MFNLDQFYVFLKDYIFDTYKDYNPAVVYPFPFGATDPDDVVIETMSEIPDLVFLIYDQEPIWDNVKFLEYYGNEFAKLGSTVLLITTQKWGRNLDHYCKKYNWTPIYYFHHALATQDWFRGYAYNPLTEKLNSIKYHSYSLNRLFDGYRSHRRWLINDLYSKNILSKGLVSFPNIDPVSKNTLIESMTLDDKKSCLYNEQIQTQLPLTIDDHENHSFEIELTQSKQCFVNVVTETVFDFHENYISEKSFKPFIQGMPMIALSTPNTLSTLQEYGFETWHEYWDESYDNMQNNKQRYKSATTQLFDLCMRPMHEIQNMYSSMIPLLNHNRNNFFSETYRNKIIQELLTNIDRALHNIRQ